MKIPQIGTIVAVIMSLITAACATVLATKGTLPVVLVVAHWVSPIWYYFLCECLYKGGGYCNYLVWVAILGLTLEAISYLILAAFPSKVDAVEKDLGDQIDLQNV